MSYKKEFEIFSNNINQAARLFYYHQEIDKQIYADGKKHENEPDGYFHYSKIYQAIEFNAQFWMDYKNFSIMSTIIILGRIFSKDKGKDKSHHVERLIETAKKSDLFTKEKLKERTITGSQNASEWIDKFLERTYELSKLDFEEIEKFVSKIRKKWDQIKSLRNKVLAHQDIISDEKKSEIFKQSKYSTFEEIILDLLKVENILWQAFYNGEKPDFTYKNTRIHEAARKDVQSLLERLSN